MSNQIANKVRGDNAGRDVNKNTYYQRPRTPMSALVEKYRTETSEDQTLGSLIEKLEHYFSAATNTDVRGLNEKLTEAGRADALLDAIARKERAAKLIMKNQASPTAQMIFAHILAGLLVSYEHTVRPLIQAGAARAEIDKAILTDVISPGIASLEDNPLSLDMLDLQGMLYFLGGNCHVRWDAC